MIFSSNYQRRIVGFPNADILVSLPDIIMSKVSPRLFNKEIGLILIGRFVGEIPLQIGHLDLTKPFSENIIVEKLVQNMNHSSVDHFVTKIWSETFTNLLYEVKTDLN